MIRGNTPRALTSTPIALERRRLANLRSFNWPYIHAPAYFDSDLGIYKTFKVTESKSLQFRVQATNFLNHPLPQFGLAGGSDDTINLQQNTNVQIPVTAINGGAANCSGNSGIGGNLDAANPAMCDVQEHSIATSNQKRDHDRQTSFQKRSARDHLFCEVLLLKANRRKQSKGGFGHPFYAQNLMLWFTTILICFRNKSLVFRCE